MGTRRLYPSTLNYDSFNEYAESIMLLMADFENIVLDNLELRKFCN